ncbi:UNKNOWN [Stylonychia lemnae]|uniref:Transmembrane protein n=1 Tax=Stylonychia lemnae TaxID=5949 RepID=A0A078AN58_STYLE|nr:UNKNOWN [Stylonychia lemnae]|eukprot:CDW83800.1 UNKNOWN [Stylonychia lemnae]
MSLLNSYRKPQIRTYFESLTEGVKDRLRKADRFGYPISLTYKQNQTFTSSFGGIMTIFSIIALLVYFFVMFSDVISKSRYTINEIKYVRDLYGDKSFYSFNLNQFDYGVQLSYSGLDPQVTNLFQYFSIKMFVFQTAVKKNYTDGEYPLEYIRKDIDIARCTQDRFAGQSDEQDNSKWWCPQVNETLLQGRMGSFVSQRLKIEFTYCDQKYLIKNFPNLTCKSREETDAISKDSFFLFGYLEQFLDVAEFEKNPIKYTLTALQYTPQTDIRFEYFGISQNYAKLRDSWLASSISVKNYTYGTITKKTSNFQLKSNRDLWVSFNFVMDENTVDTTRISYNFIDALTATGGFASIIMIVFKVLTDKIQKVLYHASIMKRLYLSMDQLCDDAIDEIIQNQGADFDKLDPDWNKKHDKLNDTSQRDLLSQTRDQNKSKEPSDQVLSEKSQLKLLKSKFKRLKYFEYSFSDYLRSKLRGCWAKVMKQKNRNIKDLLYKVGMSKLTKEFDIVRYLKKIRLATSLSELLLSDTQKELIPFFGQNVLTQFENKTKTNIYKKSKTLDDPDILHKSLKGVVRNSRKSQLDQKILKMLELPNLVEKFSNNQNLQVKVKEQKKKSKTSKKIKDSIWKDSAQTNSKNQNKNKIQNKNFNDQTKDDNSIYKQPKENNKKKVEVMKETNSQSVCFQQSFSDNNSKAYDFYKKNEKQKQERKESIQNNKEQVADNDFSSETENTHRVTQFKARTKNIKRKQDKSEEADSLSQASNQIESDIIKDKVNEDILQSFME